ncbi:4-hydroxybutyrate coenzyme A transferase domain protein [Dictyocaulus viviparus]|uniref:4-hydroxybutyrate coenzyme A transferase domain protein n=1 Tax=Dictyocaulus viviparus TaxID=29172 RepID=A0A0D8XQ57_DICVI|nr:4-hydroxybutyrate coenzyme A transferase domain protein [Dictyocaulus viviparus]
MLYSKVSLRAICTTSAVRRVWSVYFDKYERTHPIHGKKPKFCDLNDAFTHIKSGDNVYVHGIAASPTPLLKGLCDYVKANDIKGLKLHHIHLEGETPWTAEDMRSRIRSNSLFTGVNLRNAVEEGIADFNSCFLQEIPLLFRKGAIKLNAALIHVSPPDAYGYCSLGTSVDTTRAAIGNADHNMPRTLGDGVIHSSNIDVVVEDHTFPLHERHVGEQNKEEQKIGKIIAENLVEDGATLQMGKILSIKIA